MEVPWGQPACLAARVSLVFSFISNLNEVNEKAGLSKTRFLASLLAGSLTNNLSYITNAQRKVC